MAEDKKPKVDYSSNSSKSKNDGGSPSDRPEIKPVTAGKVQKKRLGAKFKETFAGDDAESVGQYVLFDVIIPRLKDMLFDTVSQGTERALFGSSSRSSSRHRSQLTGKTNYSGMSKDNSRREREFSSRSRRNHDFDEVVIPTRGEAEQVRDTLIELIDVYESATVADFYNAVEITPEHTDLKFGWRDLTDSRIVPARGGGYILELPRAEVL